MEGVYLKVVVTLSVLESIEAFGCERKPVPANGKWSSVG